LTTEGPCLWKDWAEGSRDETEWSPRVWDFIMNDFDGCYDYDEQGGKESSTSDGPGWKEVFFMD